jgi:ATP-dependent Lon protease
VWVKSQIEIIPVRWVDKVLEVALERPPTPLTDEEPAAAAPVVEGARPVAIKH